MRNLKRMLSLAVAAMMLIGMMVIGAGAADVYEDFTDKDEIQNQEAVATMVALGVFEGKDDGSYFDPTGTVTRAEMAKIVAVCLSGGVDPVTGSGSTTVQFSDVPTTHWAYKYISYCVQQGIIAGRGDGTFGPEDPVTGSAAAKMFLCALGYKADLEGLVGNDWELNTNILANQDAGLYDGLSGLDASAGLSRDNTAQMAYNAVQAQEVYYDNLTGDHSDVLQTFTKGTMLTNRFDVVKVEGIAVANDVFGIDGNTATQAGKMRLEGTSYTDTEGNVHKGYYDGNYTVALDNDLVGQCVVLYVKYQNALSPNAQNSTVLGNAIVSDKNTVVETSAKLKDNDAVKSALRGSGVSLVTSGDDTTSVVSFAAKYDDKGNALLSSTVAANGVTTAPGLRQRFIDNDGDGKADLLIRESYDLSKVTVYNTTDKKMTLAGIASGIAFEDVVGYDNVAKDDYVLVIRYEDTYYVEPVTTAEGTVSAYSKSNETVTIDGTAYAVGTGVDYTTDLDGEDLADLSDLVGNEYTLYLDKNGNIISCAAGTTTIGNYAVITGLDVKTTTGFESATVKLLLGDGTKGTYNVDLLASAKRWNATTDDSALSNSKKEAEMAKVLDALSTGTIVTYTLNSDSTVTIGQADYINADKYGATNGAVTGGAGTGTTFDKNDSTYTINSYSIVADTSTLFFIKDGDGNFSVVNGLSALSSKGVTPASGNASVVYNITSGRNVAKAIYAEITGTYTSSAAYVYVADDYSYSVEDGTDVYSYPVVFEDGTVGTLKSTDSSVDSGKVYSYSVGTDGYAEFDSDSKIVNDKIVSYMGNNTVGLDEGNNYGTEFDSYALASDVNVWNVENADANDSSSVYEDSLSKLAHVSLVLNDDGAVQTAFIIEIYEEGTDIPADVKISGMSKDSTELSYTKSSSTQTVVVKVNGATATFTADSNGLYKATVSALKSGDTITVTITDSAIDEMTRTVTYTVS